MSKLISSTLFRKQIAGSAPPNKRQTEAEPPGRSAFESPVSCARADKRRDFRTIVCRRHSANGMPKRKTKSMKYENIHDQRLTKPASSREHRRNSARGNACARRSKLPRKP